MQTQDLERFHYMGLDVRKPDFVPCEQQTAGQSAHRSLISAYVIRYLKSLL